MYLSTPHTMLSRCILTSRGYIVMTIESQAVLRGIKNMTGNMSEEFGYLTNSTCFQTDHGARYDYARYKGEIQSIVDQLLDEGYIKKSPRVSFVSFQAIYSSIIS